MVQRIQRAPRSMPDVSGILPAQAVFSSSSGERRLQAAVLEMAKHDLRSPHAGLRHAAREWVLGTTDDGDWPFTFAAICQTFGYDPPRYRQKLLAAVGITHRTLRPRYQRDPPLSPSPERRVAPAGS